MEETLDYKSTRIAILADSLALRVGLRALVEDLPGVEVIADAHELASMNSPLEDVDLLLVTGQVGLEDLVSADLGLLVLTTDQEEARQVIDSGVLAWGLLPLDVSAEDLTTAIRAVSQGMIVAEPGLYEAVHQPPVRSSAEGEALIEELTPREMEVLELLAQGFANKQIAYELEISEHTVKFHISSIYTKLGVTNRTEAVRTGFQLGLIVL